jgi:hypothetical protein
MSTMIRFSNDHDISVTDDADAVAQAFAAAKDNAFVKVSTPKGHVLVNPALVREIIPIVEESATELADEWNRS